MVKLSDLDGFDRRLIELVRANNLEPARTLADKVGLSVSAVLRRLRRLREDRIIVADISIVNPALTGSALTMHVLVRMEEAGPHAIDRFARAIIRHPEVTGVWEVSGDDDYVVKVQVATMEEYALFTRSALAEKNGVKSFKTLITMRTVLEDDLSSRPLLQG